MPVSFSIAKPSIPELARSVLAGLLLAGGLYAAAVPAQDLASVDAVFSVEINKQPTDGENRLKVSRDGTRYSVDFQLDHWMVSVDQKARFAVDDCKVRPLSYRDTSKRPLKDESTQTLDFDWVHHEAHYRGDATQKTFPLTGPTYDPISLFFEARCELMAGQKDFAYPVIRKGSVKTQRYRVVGTRSVQTGLGEFEALVVERVRSSSKRRTRLYVAPDLDYLLVRIEHRENSLLTVSVTLQTMNYQLVAQTP